MKKKKPKGHWLTPQNITLSCIHAPTPYMHPLPQPLTPVSPQTDSIVPLILKTQKKHPSLSTPPAPGVSVVEVNYGILYLSFREHVNHTLSLLSFM